MSVADELKKLSELQKQGLLTSEEFSAQKEKLLS
ncbi:MAG: SHOCT domain-containing protein [gamma proteobacterium endosymbiont of Lamellibrachia anaximandri]|nr:SHOCT domain-containing protein [gamma proteobacterium endosymbiont of Lamellibrachia anaximandri]MBL3619341.1 SHOCT domain-containing protein [gamma proteobacterium endosymbiont of Lamellibrachia anaximandri]